MNTRSLEKLPVIKELRRIAKGNQPFDNLGSVVIPAFDLLRSKLICDNQSVVKRRFYLTAAGRELLALLDANKRETVICVVASDKTWYHTTVYDGSKRRYWTYTISPSNLLWELYIAKPDAIWVVEDRRKAE